MSTVAPMQHEIVPRKDLQFRLDSEDIPRYWLGGDPYRTRFFDAMSTLFPEGEKYFIECVRDYRDQVTDPVQKDQVRDFIFQEAQHGRVHTLFNNRLKDQGIDVDSLLDEQKRVLGWYRRSMPKVWNLAQTAAAEHMTALMAHFFLEHREELADGDPRVRAIYFWHAVEEIEHKAVAFEVLTRVAKASYFTRVLAMLWESLNFPFHTFLIMRYMFNVDGLRGWRRVKTVLKGVWWLYGPRGIYMRMMPHYLAYYLPGYHPWKRGGMAAYGEWRRAYERHAGDPVTAAEEFLRAA